MALAGFLVGGAFQLLGLAPTNHHVAVFETQPAWNYTTFLDLTFLVLIVVRGGVCVRCGGVQMLRSHSHRPEAGAKVARDPVCGMSVDTEHAEHRSSHKGETYYFCSAG